MSSRHTIALVLVAALAAACGDDGPTATRGEAELRDAPTAVTIGAQSLVLEPYVYRDFAPVSPPDGKPMIAGLRIRAADGTSLPRTLRADSVWVVSSLGVWAAAVREHRFTDAPPWTYEGVAREGPKWAPGTPIDVVVRVRDGASAPRLLRAGDQVVRRTD